ncbi:MAG: hypothetical protein ABL982_25900 [Vicinamibacterales bacterium]
MPPKGFTKPTPVDRRLKVGLTVADYDAITAKADANGTTVAAYVRQLIADDLAGDDQTPPRGKASPDRSTLTLLAEVHLLAMHVKRIAITVNQIARQVDNGFVPLTADEARDMRVQVASAMERAVTLFDKVLAR